jgi:hypothetical protein
VLWNSKNLTKTADKTRYRAPGFIWCFSEIPAVAEYLVLSGVLVRFLLFQSTRFYLRYSGTVRISLKHQIKRGALEQ